MAGYSPNLVDVGTFPIQSHPGATDWDNIIAAFDRTGVVSGCAVTAQGSPDNTVAVASGTVSVAGASVAVTGGNLTMTAAHGTSPRKDIITVNSSGTKAYTAGTAAAEPVAPAIPATSALLAEIYVPANDNIINSNQIRDKRIFLRDPTTSGSPVAKTADETVNNSTAFQDDDHIFFSVAANATYFFELFLLVQDSGTNTNVKIQFTWPTSTTMEWALEDVDAAGNWSSPGAVDVKNESGTMILTTEDFDTAGVRMAVKISGWIYTVGTAGTFRLQWAQNGAEAAATILKKGSWIRPTRLI